MRSEDIQRRPLFFWDWRITWCFSTKGVTHTEEGVTQRRGDTHREYTHSICRKRVHILCWRMWIKHEINIPLQKLNWWQKEKNVKKKIIQSSSPTAMQTKQNNLQISRSRGKWSIKFIEDLNKMQSTEFTRPRRKNEFWQTEPTPSLCTSLCWKNAS